MESDKTSGYSPEIEHRNRPVLFRLAVPLIERVDSTGIAALHADESLVSAELIAQS